jgi:hypothetical protein
LEKAGEINKVESEEYINKVKINETRYNQRGKLKKNEK